MSFIPIKIYSTPIIKVYILLVIKGDFMKKLVIDLGHGGHDPGAIGPNKTNEADIVLSIGKELDNMLYTCC